MKKFLLLLSIIPCMSLFAQEGTASYISVGSTIVNVSEKGKYISVICVDKEKNKTMANLYNKDGKKLVSISDPINNGLLFAEYVERMGYYLVCFEGYEGYNGDDGERGKVQAIDITTGKIIWECFADALSFEVSPNEEYLLTKSPSEGELNGIFEIIRLKDGSKISLTIKYEKFKAAWFDNDRVLILSNKESYYQPVDKTTEFKNWREDLQKREQQNFDNYGNKKISKDEYESKDKKYSAEFFEKSREYAERIRQSTSLTIVSKIILYNILDNKVEIEKSIVDENGNPLVADISGNDLCVLTIDKDKNSYILCKLPSRAPDETIYSFIKNDKNLKLIWKSPLLPLANYYKYSLDSKPYFGLKINDTETFVEPVNGKLLQLVDLKQVFPQVPSINSLQEYKQDIFVDDSNLEIDLKNNNLILK